MEDLCYAARKRKGGREIAAGVLHGRYTCHVLQGRIAALGRRCSALASPCGQIRGGVLCLHCRVRCGCEIYGVKCVCIYLQDFSNVDLQANTWSGASYDVAAPPVQGVCHRCQSGIGIEWAGGSEGGSLCLRDRCWSMTWVGTSEARILSAVRSQTCLGGSLYHSVRWLLWLA